MSEFEKIVTIARTPEQFCNAVRSTILAGPDPTGAAARRAFARQNDWNQKVSTILSLLERYLSGVRPQ
jgi:hypothetical protein